MYPVSQDFKEAVYAPSRYTTARVTFDISDVTAAEDVVNIDTSPEFSLSIKNQINDNVRQTTSKLVTWEKDRFKLDGSFSFADSVISNNDQVGYVSSVLCDEFGVFSSEVYVDITFSEKHSSIGITVSFDPLNDEYAKTFDIVAYRDGVAFLTVNVEENSESIRVVEGLFENYDALRVLVKDWNVPMRRVRIAEIDFGVLKVYDDEKLIRLSLIEEMDITSGTLPLSEFKFTVDNSDRAFNILNPTGIYAYLQKRQQIIGEVGVVVNGIPTFIPIGNYLLSDWQSDEGSLTTTFTASTNFEVMTLVEYENKLPIEKTLYDLAVEIFALCGITNYILDPYLKTLTTNSLIEKRSCREVLILIAIAGECNVYVSRTNQIIVKRFPDTMESPVDTIDLDNVYEEPKIVLDKIVREVQVSYFTDLNNSVVVSVQNPEVNVGEVLTVSNTLINNIERANAVATWLLRQKSYRGIHDITGWRGNPSHELGDVVSIENSYGSNKNAIIVKNELMYEGYLRGTTQARGVV